MTGIYDLSRTAGSNTPLINIGTIAGPGDVDDAIRNLASYLAKYRDDLGAGITTGGSANAHTLTTYSGLLAGTLTEGARVSFTAGFTNTAGTTLNVDSLGGIALRKYTVAGLVALDPGNLVVGGKYDAVYESSGTTQWVLLNPTFGGQLQFPATQNASSGVNVLDDYEEGTWTPVLTFATPGNLAVTYNTQDGRYIKIGRMVLVTAHIRTSAFTHTTAAGAVQITGLPFASVTTGAEFLGGAYTNGISASASWHTIVPYIVGNTSYVSLVATSVNSGVGATAINAASMASGGAIVISATVMYEASA